MEEEVESEVVEEVGVKTTSQEIDMDFAVRKQLERVNENCNEQPYSYFGKIVL